MTVTFIHLLLFCILSRENDCATHSGVDACLLAAYVDGLAQQIAVRHYLNLFSAAPPNRLANPRSFATVSCSVTPALICEFTLCAGEEKTRAGTEARRPTGACDGEPFAICKGS